jgi:hypothetical protein
MDKMVDKVKEAMANLTPRDVVVVQFLDNTSYMALSEYLIAPLR